MLSRTKKLDAAMLETASAKQRSGLVILVFANYAYLDVLLNWLIAIDRLKIDNYIIVALDRKLHRFLSKRGFPSVLSPLRGGMSQLWIKRIRIFRLLVDNGFSFIHSDTDAIWLKDPLHQYFSSPQQDLVVSQGTTWPPDIVQQRGFVFCCGLFYLQSSDISKILLERMEADVEDTGDDQITLNRIVETFDMRWNINRAQTYELEHRDTRFLCSRQPILGESASTSLRVSLLPHHAFQRLHMPDEEAFVKHLLSPKKSDKKLEMFRETNCLFLSPDWQAIDFDADSIGRLARESP